MGCSIPWIQGYVPPDKFVKPEEEDLTKPLNAEDEVALLLKEEIGVSGSVKLWGLYKIEQSLGVKVLCHRIAFV